MAQSVENPPVMQETWLCALGWEGPLEKEMATHSSILAWKSPWMAEPGRLLSMGSQRVKHDLTTKLPPYNAWKLFGLSDLGYFIYKIGENNTFTSLCIIGSSFIHLIRTDSNVFFLMAA